MQYVSGLGFFSQYGSMGNTSRLLPVSVQMMSDLGCCYGLSKPIISWKYKKMPKARPNILALRHSTRQCVSCLPLWLCVSMIDFPACAWGGSGFRVPSAYTGCITFPHQYSEPITGSLGPSVLLCRSVSIWLYLSSAFYLFYFYKNVGLEMS